MIPHMIPHMRFHISNMNSVRFGHFLRSLFASIGLRDARIPRAKCNYAAAATLPLFRAFLW